MEENGAAVAVEPTPSDLREIDGVDSKIAVQGARYPEHLDRLTGRRFHGTIRAQCSVLGLLGWSRDFEERPSARTRIAPTNGGKMIRHMSSRWQHFPRACAFVLLVVLAFSQVACGYFKAGAWDDDPGNWSRAFDSTKPPGVNVLHSKYRRSPHWSYEFEYFFAIEPEAELTKQLFTENKLHQMNTDEAAQAKATEFSSAPAWFAPKSAAEYDVWIFADEPGRHFRVLIDKQSGTLFLADQQM